MSAHSDQYYRDLLETQDNQILKLQDELNDVYEMLREEKENHAETKDKFCLGFIVFFFLVVIILIILIINI